MDFLKNLPFTPMTALKAAGAVVGVVVVLTLVSKTLGPAVGIAPLSGYAVTSQGVAPSSAPGYGGGASYDYAEEAAYNSASDKLMLSVRNAVSAMPPIAPSPQPQSTGAMAEAYEVTDYSVSIETRDRDTACPEVAKLKAHSYVIFENANEHDQGCSYIFKVERDRVPEILAYLEELNPKRISENTYTIQQQVEDFTSQEDILKNKLATVESTLETATVAYDEITALASRTNDAESLARVITSKLNTIERLTQERITISAQLDELSRAKARQLDGLTYTRFSVGVYELKYVDFENIKDSWKRAVAATVSDINEAIQAATLGLIAFLVLIAQWLLYIILLLVIGKYLWRFGKSFWNA